MATVKKSLRREPKWALLRLRRGEGVIAQRSAFPYLANIIANGD
jgi:hypothetical protein